VRSRRARQVFAFGIGYGLAVSLGGLFMAVCAPQRLPRTAALQALGATTHGLRLAHYLFARDARAAMPADYRAQVAAMEGDTSPLGRLKRLPLVAACASMYALIMAPLALASAHPAPAEDGVQWAGVALQWAGLLAAALADWQKAAHKRRHPGRWCDSGLYKCVACRGPRISPCAARSARAQALNSVTARRR
jgi:steroid 5-alpha reductase family enzyme